MSNKVTFSSKFYRNYETVLKKCHLATTGIRFVTYVSHQEKVDIFVLLENMTVYVKYVSDG